MFVGTAEWRADSGEPTAETEWSRQRRPNGADSGDRMEPTAENRVWRAVETSGEPTNQTNQAAARPIEISRRRSAVHFMVLLNSV
jgi:hypothetical protein